jgi:hypothetical protein
MLSKAFKQVYRTQQLNSVAVRSFAHHAHDQPKRVVVTGAAGQIAYATLFRIAR